MLARFADPRGGKACEAGLKSREKNKRDGDALEELTSSGNKSWEEKVREIK